MPKDAEKVAAVPKLPHEIAAEELEMDFLKQRVEYLRRRQEIMEDELKYLKMRNHEYKAKKSAAEYRLADMKKMEAQRKKRTSDLGPSLHDVPPTPFLPELPDFPIREFPTFSETPSVIFQPYTAPEFNFTTQEEEKKEKKKEKRRSSKKQHKSQPY